MQLCSASQLGHGFTASRRRQGACGLPQARNRASQLPARPWRHIARVATPELAQLRPSEPQHTVENAPEASQDTGFQPITAMWARNAVTLGDQVALLEPHRSPVVSITYRELWGLISDYAAGLAAHGLQQGERVCLFAESSSRWIVADQAILLNGAADAVRGSSSPADELSYILSHSGASGLVLQDSSTAAALLPAVKQALAAGQAIKFVALLWEETPAAAAAGAAQQNGSSSSNGHGSSNGNGAKQQQQQKQAAGAAAVSELQALGVTVLSYQQVLAAGRQLRNSNTTHNNNSHTTNNNNSGSSSSGSSSGGGFTPARVRRSDLATLVYTSGTTGHPKGVMLSHGNLAYQVDHLDYFLPVSAGDSTLSLLPPWHIYQRSVAYYLFSRGAREVFTSLRHFKEDLTAHPPDHFVCVPLVLDTLHSRVNAQLSREAKGLKGVLLSLLLSASFACITARRLLQGRDLRHATAPPAPQAWLLAAVTAALTAPLYALAQKLVWAKVRAGLGIKRTIISGGGSLASHLDLFFEALGLTVLNGWGLTETSPVLACRRPSANVRGSVGVPTPGTQIRVVDPHTHERVPDGQQGLLLAAGPGVMSGYWQDTAATRKAFIDGWFDTGDLGWRAPAGVAGSNMAGHIVLTGRAKDTLVLLSGKNIEPQPIEDALCRSPYIKHVVLFGQDKRELGALVFPDEEVLAAQGTDAGADSSNNSSSSSGSSSSSSSSRGLEALLLREVGRFNASRPDYHPEDHIAHIQVVRSPLSVEAGTLTRTMKPRRPAIAAVFAAEVAQLNARLRG